MWQSSFFLVGNITIRGVIVHTIAGSFVANLWLMNDHIAPVSSIAGTANPWMYTDKYKRPHWICTLLSDGLSTLPLTFCLLTASVSLLLLIVHAHITELCSFITRCLPPVGYSFVVLRLLWCFQTVLGNMSHFSTIVEHWSSWLTNALYIIHLSSYL